MRMVTAQPPDRVASPRRPSRPIRVTQSAARSVADRRLIDVRLLIALGLCVASAYVLVSRGSTSAVAIVLLPVVAYALTRHLGGLLVGLAMLLTLPYWQTLGSAQAGVLRIASLMAAITWILGRHRKLSPPDFALAALVAVSAVNLYFQDNQPHAARLLIDELEPVAFYLAARQLTRPSVVRVMDVAFFVGMIGALSVLYEAFLGHLVFHDPATYYWNATDSTIFRPGGIFGSPPAASAVLSMTAMCGLPAIRRLTGWRRSAAWICLGVTLLAVVLTFTRAALIGLTVGVLVYLYLSRSVFLRPRAVIAGLTAVAVIAVVLLPTLETSTTFQQGIIRPGTFEERVSYWQLAIPIATSSTHNLIFGIGAEAAEVPVLGGTSPSALATAPVLIAHGTHNQYILTLLELGLIGLIALLAWLGLTLIWGITAAMRDRDPVPAALTAAVAVFAIVMLAGNSMLNGPSLALGALASGLILAYRADHPSDTAAAPDESVQSGVSSRSGTLSTSVSAPGDRP